MLRRDRTSARVEPHSAERLDERLSPQINSMNRSVRRRPDFLRRAKIGQTDSYVTLLFQGDSAFAELLPGWPYQRYRLS